MTDRFAILSVIATALRDSLVAGLKGGKGFSESLLEGNEQTIPIAKAVVAALDSAGLEIVPKAKQ